MIAVVYIGERKFKETSLANHTELFNLIESKYNLKIARQLPGAVSPLGKTIEL